MKNRTFKILGTLFITILLILIGNHVSNAAYAYISPVDNNQRTVTVGESVSIKAYGSAMAWNLKASGTGISGGSIVDGNLSEKKNKSFMQTYTLDTSKAGTYTLYLTGDITDADGTFSEVNDSVTIVVNEKSNSDNNNNDNNNNATESEPSFTKTNDTVYSTGSVNVRKSYSTESSIIGSLSEGEEVKRDATGDNGWSRITYNGGIGYVKTSLLTTTKPEEEKSADKALKSLKVKPEGLDPEFNPDTTIYSLTVGADVDKLEIEAEAASDKAKVEITGNDELKDGENTVKITVTAEDGTARTYTINVTKAAKTDIVLKSLKVKGYDLNPAFDPDVFTYKLTLKDDSVTKLDIEALAISDDYEVTITGNENFKNGQNIVKIIVKAKDSDDETTYKIYVNKSTESAGIVSAKDSNKKSKLPLYIGIALIVILIIAIIVVVIRNRNAEDYYDEDEEDDDDDKIDNSLYGYSSKNNKQFEDKTIMYNTNSTNESQLDKVEGNDNVDDFDFNPYTKNGISNEPINTSRAPSQTQDRDLFGTINGVDESYKYVDDNKDDLSEALNNYKEQEKQEINTPFNNQDNNEKPQNDSNKETFSGVNSFDYNSYLENSYGYYDDDRPKRSRGKHSR